MCELVIILMDHYGCRSGVHVAVEATQDRTIELRCCGAVAVLFELIGANLPESRPIKLERGQGDDLLARVP